MRGVARARQQVRSLRELRSWACAVRTAQGKPLRSQLAEIAALRRSRLAAREYYEYRLFDDSRFTAEQKREYTGRNFQWKAYRAVNDPGLVAKSGIRGSWNGMIDKALLDMLMRAADIPCPVTHAVFDESGAGGVSPSAALLQTTEQLETALRLHAASGGFVKPARTASGDGAFSIVRIDADGARLGNGETHAVAVLAARIASLERAVIQERLRPHPALAAAVGEAIGTLRVVVLRHDTHSDIHRVVYRIPAGTSMVDNFAKGSRGNMVGVVDTRTGVVRRVYAGVGLDQQHVDRHPDTGQPLVNLGLPDWDAALALIVHASAAFPAMRLQSWDVALTDRGPLMIELNDVSSQDVLQLGGPPGMLDRELCAFLREHGFRWPYPHSA